MPENESQKEKKVAFIIAPIGDEGTPVRERIDGLLAVLFKPVLEELGYDVIAPHRIARPGSITDQIIEHLLNDDLVVCDLTTLNPNVMYELAVRHGIDKPFILVADSIEKDRIPFDLSADRVLLFKDSHLGVIKAKAELKAAVEEIERGEKTDNPITRYLQRASIERQVPESDPIGYLIRENDEIKNALRQISEKLADNMATPVLATAQSGVSAAHHGSAPFETVLFDVTVKGEGELLKAVVDSVRNSPFISECFSRGIGSHGRSFRISTTQRNAEAFTKELMILRDEYKDVCIEYKVLDTLS